MCTEIFSKRTCDGPQTDSFISTSQSGRTTLARALQAKHADVQELVFFDSAHLIPANDADDVETPLRILLRNKGPLQRKKEVTPLRESHTLIGTSHSKTDFGFALVRAFMRKVDDVSDLQLIYRLPAFSAPGPSAGDKDIENACESFLTGLARRRGNIKKVSPSCRMHRSETSGTRRIHASRFFYRETCPT